MTRNVSAAASASTTKPVQLLVDASVSDTVYADIYMNRARELLGSVLTAAQYHALKGIQADIDTVVTQSKAATILQDWQRVGELAARVDELRRTAQEQAPLMALGAKVYDAPAVNIDPFSPGFDFLPGFDQELGERRDALVGTLKGLVGADAPLASFYEARRTFFAGLTLASKRSVDATPVAQSNAELEQLAMQAAQRGDMTQLRSYAQELAERQTREQSSAAPKSGTSASEGARATYQCPVDLTVPFSEDVAQRAGTLGFAVLHAEPLPQGAPLYDYVITHIWQPSALQAATEHEGALHAEAIVDELGFPAEVSEHTKVLVGQLLKNPFINSGGARYLPLFKPETILIEDFPEDQEPPASGDLLSALGLPRRRGLARQAIDAALSEHGATVLRERIGLDPYEFRLVCIPQELYTRCGRERGWGQQPQWTHFDGYQVLKNGQLRALAGGDVRYGGVVDLVSVGMTDERDSVVARFAVIRRARQVARWR